MLHSTSDLYGASKMLLYTVECLLSQKNNVTVFLSEEGELISELQNRRVNVKIFDLGILRKRYFNISGVLNRIKAIAQSYSRIKAFVKDNNVSLVYSNTIAVFVGAFVARRMHIKHIWHVHEIVDKPILFSWFIGKLLNTCSTKIIVVSEAVKSHWQRYIKKVPIEVIHNGIDYGIYLSDGPTIDDELKRTKNTIVIGMIGRVQYWKGQDYFLKIAGRLYRDHKNVLFVMVGDAFQGYEYLYEKLTDLKRTLSIEKVVLDLRYRKDIANILRSFDIFILPSILPDPFPTVVLEAMASGKVVVATNHGGATEMIIDGDTGFLIPFDDEARAAKIVEQLIENKELRRQVGAKARERVLKHFSSNLYKTKLMACVNAV
jgi:glycosyltransferase involved in cell wall biosynthesis